MRKRTFLLFSLSSYSPPFDLFAHLAFDLFLKALRHSFAITKEGQRKASLPLWGGVIQLPGVPVIISLLLLSRPNSLSSNTSLDR